MVEIESSEEQLSSITEMINGANNAISTQNNLVKHYDEEKDKLINDNAALHNWDLFYILSEHLHNSN